MADVLVLCYHALSPAWGVDVSVTPEAFERQVNYLARSGWTFATFAQAILAPPARRTAVVTFDDAFASVKRFAAPVLSELKAPATVFVPTSYISAGKPLAWSGLDHWMHTPHASELTGMTWDDLRELADGGWEIGSHTCTHPFLTRLPDAEVKVELAQSREECRERMGRPCETIAYPYGDVDERVAALAAASGYRAGGAISSRLEPLGPYRAPRTGIFHGDAWWKFRVKVARPVRFVRATKLWPGARAGQSARPA